MIFYFNVFLTASPLSIQVMFFNCDIFNLFKKHVLSE